MIPWAGSTGENTTITAAVDGNAQYVTTPLRASGYDSIQVTAGIPVVWTIAADEASLNGCNSELVLPEFDQQVKLNVGTTVITFTPEKAGVYPYSCWMGMLKSNTIVTEAQTSPISSLDDAQNVPACCIANE